MKTLTNHTMKQFFILIVLTAFSYYPLPAQERYELQLPDDHSRLWANPVWKGKQDTIRWEQTFREGGFFWRDSRYKVSFSDGESLLFHCPRGQGCRVMDLDSVQLVERTERHYVLKDGTLLRLKFNLNNTRIRVFSPNRRLIAEARTRHRIFRFKHELYIELYEDVTFRKELLVQLSRDMVNRARRR